MSACGMSDPTREQLEAMMRGQFRDALRAAESYGWPSERVGELATEAGILPTTPPPPPPPDAWALLSEEQRDRVREILVARRWGQDARPALTAEELDAALSRLGFGR
jgi:hypothetical protein